MHVVATAGHVDHGKSTLVRALTGVEPDRWAEERRRGLTIDLGFAWTTLPSGAQIAFVDVPGHERFVTNMLAGVGPAPAVLFVVAADEGWAAQSEEHLQALAALGVEHVLVVVTKADLAPAAAAAAQARERFAAAGLTPPDHVEVSAATGVGLDELRAALEALATTLPTPDAAAPARLWIDRAFTIRGAGTVVTGTLPAGAVTVGDELALTPAGRPVTVRALQSQGADQHRVDGVARVAVNLRGVRREDVARGMALVTPDAWASTVELDALVEADDLPAEIVVHIGAAAVSARLRRLADKAVRVRLAHALPLHVGDRLLLRDPASRRVGGAVVADLHPQPLRRRGDAHRVGNDLHVPATADDEVTRQRMCTDVELRAAGLLEAPQHARRVDNYWIDRDVWTQLRARLRERVGGAGEPSAGVPLQELRRELALPDVDIVTALARDTGDVVIAEGRARASSAAAPELAALQPLLDRLAADPLAAPDSTELAGLARAELAAAVRAGRLLRLTEGVYVGPTAPEWAAGRLQALPDAPFTVSAAREVLGSSRRVVVPLLEHLDAARVTRKLPDGTRLLVARAA